MTVTWSAAFLFGLIIRYNGIYRRQQNDRIVFDRKIDRKKVYSR